MSIKVAMGTPHKKQVAELLRATAALIEMSSNQTVDVIMTVTFNKCEEDEE